MQGVLPLKPLSNQKSSQTVVDMFTDDGLLVGQVAKKGITGRQVSDLSYWMEAWNILHSDCAQTALELVKYQHIICQLFAPDGSSLEFQAGSPPHQQALLHRLVHTERGAGSQAVVENTLPRPGHVLHQWPRDLHELTPLYDQQAHTTLRTTSSHHSTTSKLIPLYKQRAHTTLRPVSSHHSATSELTPLYDQRAHTTLRPASSYHSTNSELTPLYDHELTPLYDQRAHTTLRPASSYHSTMSELTPLYDQRAHTTLRPVSSHHSTTSETHITLQPASSHHSTTSELTPLRPASSHHSMTSELTPLYDQWNSHHSMTSGTHTILRLASSHHSTNSELSLHHSTTSELTPLYDHELTPYYDQWNSHHSMTSELTPLYDQREERNEEKAKEVRARYEKELSNLKVELKTLKSAKKEHAKALKMNVQQENELKRLKADLLEMKKQRVKMLNQMRTEATTKKLEDQRKSKEIAQLKKDSQKKECRIKSLEADAKRREFVLKRRQEELAALRKNTLRTIASAGSLPMESGAMFVLPAKDEISPSSTMVRRKSSVFTSEGAKKKWRDLERKVLGTIMRRKTVNVMSSDMDHWIEKRGELSKHLDELKGQRARLMEADKVDSDEVTSVDEDLDSVTANIEYVQQNILELQNELIAVEDARTGEGDTVEAHSIIMSCNPRECKYIMEHLLDLVLHLVGYSVYLLVLSCWGVTAQQKEADVKALEARLKASEHSVEVITSLSTPQLQPPISASRTITKSSSHLVIPQGLPPPPLLLHDTESTSSEDGKHSDSSSEALGSKMPRGTDHTDNEASRADRGDGVDTKIRRRTALPADILSTSRRQTGLLTGMSRSPIVDVEEGEVDQSDGRSTDGESSGSVVECKPDAHRRGGLTVAASRHTIKERSKSVETLGTSPPSSAVSRNLQESRRSGSGRLLTCVHTASGHTAAVTSVYADQNLLFSASQDRTVKAWDLKTSTELLTLEKHLSYVRSIKYCPHTRLIFTASQNIIKIWDMRNHKAQCVKTFGSPTGSSDAVQDLLVFGDGGSLFSASGNIVNIWDLQKMVHVGKLTGHNAGVSSLAVLNNLLITGSRDRLIKLYDLDAVQFDVVPTAGVVVATYPPQHTLQPPHYDAVTSFAVHSKYLYSACGVTIKQWDMRLHSLKQAVDGAHPQGSVIHSLGIFPASTPLLVSGCKGGLVKLWNTESCTNIGEVQAHKGSVNSIATNDSFIFSGSSDKTIRIWKLGTLPDS
eukprot:Em0008g311a